MTPFSSLTYIKENKKRCLLLACVLACIMVCYLGGLYITNPIEMDRQNIEAKKGITYIDSQEYRDAGAEGMKKVLAEIEKADPDGAVLLTYSPVYFSQQTVLSYDINYYAVGFRSSKDFDMFNKCLHILPEGTVINNGEIIISDLIADYIDVRVGDIINSDTYKTGFEDEDIQELKVAAIIESNSFISYVVNESENFIDRRVLYTVSSDKKAAEMDTLLERLDKEYEDVVNIGRYNERIKSSKEFYATYYLIFTAIIVLVASVLAITLNAILSGIYYKRKYEFAVYNAIGFSKGEIRRKIAGEILMLNISGILLGTLIIILVIFFVNGLLLEGQGMHLNYYHPVALLATFICDICVVIPTIFIQSAHMNRSSIDQY